MKKGELVLVPFPFTDLSSMKNRPALVLLDNDEDATLSFITTQKRWAKEWDIYLEPTDQNGLKKPSIVRLAKITTLEKSLIMGRLGMVSHDKLNELQQKLRMLFDI
jgi:mRNA interferase MazF